MADQTPATFTTDSARRVAAATRKVEAMPLRYGARPNPPRDAEDSIWAVLTGHNVMLAASSGYSWVQVAPNTGDGWVPLDGGARGIENAYEATGKWPIPVPTVVRLYVGPDDPDTGEQRWTFVYDQDAERFGYLPPHDHRDNYNGGFAFAVFHPGTAIPQQPWAL